MTLLQETPTTVFPEAGEHVADRPAEARGAARDDVRLLVARPGRVDHRRFADLADELEPGDLVVVNNSATVAGQLDVVDGAGRARVLHLATRSTTAPGWSSCARPRPPPTPCSTPGRARCSRPYRSRIAGSGSS